MGTGRDERSLHINLRTPAKPAAQLRSPGSGPRLSQRQSALTLGIPAHNRTSAETDVVLALAFLHLVTQVYFMIKFSAAAQEGGQSFINELGGGVLL